LKNKRYIERKYVLIKERHVGGCASAGLVLQKKMRLGIRELGCSQNNEKRTPDKPAVIGKGSWHNDLLGCVMKQDATLLFGIRMLCQMS
jgi:hypothetical protein